LGYIDGSGVLQCRQGWRPERAKKEVGRVSMEKGGLWQCDCRWDFHSVLMVWEVGSGGTHLQWFFDFGSRMSLAFPYPSPASIRLSFPEDIHVDRNVIFSVTTMMMPNS
jgi:hypothetical protein